LIEVEARLDLAGATFSVSKEAQDRDPDRMRQCLPDLCDLRIPRRNH
jgi:hypothetical protein